MRWPVGAVRGRRGPCTRVCGSAASVRVCDSRHEWRISARVEDPRTSGGSAHEWRIRARACDFTTDGKPHTRNEAARSQTGRNTGPRTERLHALPLSSRATGVRAPRAQRTSGGSAHERAASPQTASRTLTTKPHTRGEKWGASARRPRGCTRSRYPRAATGARASRTPPRECAALLRVEDPRTSGGSAHERAASPQTASRTLATKPHTRGGGKAQRQTTTQQRAPPNNAHPAHPAHPEQRTPCTPPTANNAPDKRNAGARTEVRAPASGSERSWGRIPSCSCPG
ncbi:hypothetical protein EV139_1505 [Leucobacter luti]|uniref:Uncharacterized protein n=1 Tax=Leucobacter luti TaxID=340320 RepID=A0A4V6MCX4_9MICO|nr:hypothetical protein EV139_1505 [Leucobacter luti]